MAVLITRDLSNPKRNQATRINLYEGLGTPEGAITGNVGDMFLRRDGSEGNVLYIKNSGHKTNTGWGSAGGGALQQEKTIYVATGGETEVSTVFDIASGDVLTVLKNGIQQDEGSSYEYTLDYDTDKVIFNVALSSGARITIIRLS